MDRPRYSDHLSALMALISYLALTDKKSRTTPSIARDLNLPPLVVRDAFDGFPGIFRRSANVDGHDEPYYTLHARYALREASAKDAGDVPWLPQLQADILKVLLDFVASQAQAEQARQLQDSAITAARRNARLAAAAAIAAAVLAAVAAILRR